VRGVSGEEEERIKEEHREAAEQKIAQLREAAEQGNAEAQYQIGYEYIRIIAMPSSERSYYVIGNFTFPTWRGTALYQVDRRVLIGCTAFSIDREEGIKWLRKAAEQGHVEAQYQLGMAYAMTIHSRPDGTTERPYHAEGSKWLHRAAEQGHVDAHFILGFHYLYQEDKAEAIKWFRRAESLGHVGASAHLRRMEESK
jgi:TPR repeat protein